MILLGAVVKQIENDIVKEIKGINPKPNFNLLPAVRPIFDPLEFISWSRSVRIRDKLCYICGGNIRLQAHHILPKRLFPEKSFEIQNGISLCSDCHFMYHLKYKIFWCNKDTLEKFKSDYNSKKHKTSIPKNRTSPKFILSSTKSSWVICCSDTMYKKIDPTEK